MQSKKIIVWDWPTRLGHWLLAISFVVAYVSAESERWRLVHVVSGNVVIGVVLFRLVWGFVGSRYALFSEFLTTPSKVLTYLRSYLPGAAQGRHYLGHNPAGGWAVVLLLLSAGLAGTTGLLAYHYPDLNRIGQMHEWLANSAIAMVCIHVAGVFVSSWVHKENLLRAMFTGIKLGKLGQGIACTHWKAAIVLLMWVGGMVFFLR